MSDIAIRVENLSKQYKIGMKRHYHLKDALTHRLNGFFRRSPGLTPNSPPSTLNSRQADHIWALKDVSFEVKQGETLGIIGANGAGKSTLLKILSRITEPTSGRAEVYSRVGSLLEVGTGFHHELTGRENIYLNGAILGMAKCEIDRKFDEIVDFSGVEQFIDTPVKRYSSGMYVRLAFAVAAHLEPEILIVDEVLAVGDAAFQRKCLGKMGDVAREGRTVLFVSHNMVAVKNICPRVLLLKSGQIGAIGAADSVVEHYLGGLSSIPLSWKLDADVEPRSGNGKARIRKIEIVSLSGEPVVSIPMGRGIVIRMEITASSPMKSAVIIVGTRSPQGEICCRINSMVTRNWSLDLHAGQSALVECQIPVMNLAAGQHKLWFQIIESDECVDLVDNFVPLDVTPADVFNTGRIPWGTNIFFLDANWDLVSADVGLESARKMHMHRLGSSDGCEDSK